jgi:hypothetical protein
MEDRFGRGVPLWWSFVVRVCWDVLDVHDLPLRSDCAVYRVDLPPLTLRVSPTTSLDSADARKTKAGASSTCCPARPSGTLCPNFGNLSLGCPSETGSGVQIGPGATALTLMVRGAS